MGNPEASAIRERMNAKRDEGKALWAELEKARTENEEKLLEGDKETVDHVAEIHDKYMAVDAEVKALEDSFSKAASWDAKGPQKDATPAQDQKPEMKTLGQKIVDSPEFRAWAEKGYTGSMGEIEVKTLFDTTSGSGGPYIITDYRQGIVPLLFQRLTIADLCASGQTTSNSLTYFIEKTWTNAADAVAEAGLKPEDTYAGDTVVEPVRKIAHMATVTDEMLEDFAATSSYLDSRLRVGVQIKEEAELYGGSGTAPHLKGIVGRTGVLTQAISTDVAADAIYKAITQVRNNFMEPDGLVIHPTDWQAIRLSKDTNKQYYGGGPFTAAYGNANGLISDRGQLGSVEQLWNQLNVVVTTAATQGTALVGAFSTQAQIFRRTGLTVEATNAHDTNFAYNKIAVRAEERLALAVYRPTGFVKVTGTFSN